MPSNAQGEKQLSSHSMTPHKIIASSNKEDGIQYIYLSGKQRTETGISSNQNSSSLTPQSQAINRPLSPDNALCRFNSQAVTQNGQPNRQVPEVLDNVDTITEKIQMTQTPQILLLSQNLAQNSDEFHSVRNSSSKKTYKKKKKSSEGQNKQGDQENIKQTKSTKGSSQQQKSSIRNQMKEQSQPAQLQNQNYHEQSVPRSKGFDLEFDWSLAYDMNGKSKSSLHIVETYAVLTLVKYQLKLLLLKQFCKHSKAMYSDVQQSLLKRSPNNEKNGLGPEQTVVKQISLYQNKMQEIVKEQEQNDHLFSEKHAIFTIRSLIEESFYYKYLAYNMKSIQFEHFFQRFHTFAFTIYQTYNAIKYYHLRQQPEVSSKDIYLYRGFIISEDQFQSVQIGSIIQIPSAFSASSDIKVALGYSDLRNLYRKPEKKYILQIKVKQNLKIPSKYQCLNHGFMKVEDEEFDANRNQNEYIFNHLNIFKIIGTSIKDEIHYVELQYGAIFQILNKESQSRTQQQKEVVATVLYHLSQAEGYDLGSLFSEFVTNQQFNSFFRQIERKQCKNVEELFQKRTQQIKQLLKNGQIQCAEKLIEDNKRLVTAQTKNEALQFGEKAQECTSSKRFDILGAIDYIDKKIQALSKEFKLAKESYSKAYQSELWLQKIKTYLDKIQLLLLTKSNQRVKSAKSVIDLVNGEIIKFSNQKNKQKHNYSPDEDANQQVKCFSFSFFTDSVSLQDRVYQNSVIETIERDWKEFHVQYQRSLDLKVKVQLFLGNKKQAEVYKREFLQDYLSKGKISCAFEGERSPQINRLIQCFKVSFLSQFEEETYHQTERKFVKENIESLRQKIKKATGKQKRELCIEAASNTKILANIQKQRILSVLKPKQIQKCRNWNKNLRSVQQACYTDRDNISQNNEWQWKKTIDAEKKEHQILQKSYNETRNLMEDAVDHLQFLGGQKERKEACEMKNEIAVLDLEMQEFDRCLQSMKYFEKQWCIGSKHQAINYHTAALSYVQTGQYGKALNLLRRAKSIYEQCFILPQNKKVTLKILRSQSEYQQICVKKTQILSLISLQKFNQEKSIEDYMKEMEEDLLGLKQCQKVNQSKFQGASRLNTQILRLEAQKYRLAQNQKKFNKIFEKAIAEKNRQIGHYMFESSRLKDQYIRHMCPVYCFNKCQNFLKQIQKTVQKYQYSSSLTSICYFYYGQLAEFHDQKNEKLKKLKSAKKEEYLNLTEAQKSETAESLILQNYKNCLQCLSIRHNKQQIQYIETRRRAAMFKLKLSEESENEEWKLKVRMFKEEAKKELHLLDILLSSKVDEAEKNSIDDDSEQSQMNSEKVDLKKRILKQVRQKLQQLSLDKKYSEIHPAEKSWHNLK